MATHRDAQLEAGERVGPAYDPRVLEPSPPADPRPPYLAADPLAAGWPSDELPRRPVVSPVGTADVTWDVLCLDDPELRPWCAARWLGALEPLPVPPRGLNVTVESLHAVAGQVMAPWRRRHQDRIGLRWTLGGFGTPFVPGDRQLRVEDGQLVLQEPGGVRSVTLESLAACASLVADTDRPDTDRPDTDRPDTDRPDTDWAGDGRPLQVEPDAAAWLAGWFGFATRVLEELRVGEPDADRHRVQLWPEHFDVAVDLGDGLSRATFGASPGDEDHDGPYLYVAAGEPGRLEGSARSDPAFNGVSLPVAELAGVPDQLDAARAFYEHHRVHLAGA
jgi:hypothetical protein